MQKLSDKQIKKQIQQLQLVIETEKQYSGEEIEMLKTNVLSNIGQIKTTHPFEKHDIQKQLQQIRTNADLFKFINQFQKKRPKQQKIKQYKNLTLDEKNSKLQMEDFFRQHLDQEVAELIYQLYKRIEYLFDDDYVSETKKYLNGLKTDCVLNQAKMKTPQQILLFIHILEQIHHSKILIEMFFKLFFSNQYKNRNYRFINEYEKRNSGFISQLESQVLKSKKAELKKQLKYQQHAVNYSYHDVKQLQQIDQIVNSRAFLIQMRQKLINVIDYISQLQTFKKQQIFLLQLKLSIQSKNINASSEVSRLIEILHESQLYINYFLNLRQLLVDIPDDYLKVDNLDQNVKNEKLKQYFLEQHKIIQSQRYFENPDDIPEIQLDDQQQTFTIDDLQTERKQLQQKLHQTQKQQGQLSEYILNFELQDNAFKNKMKQVLSEKIKQTDDYQKQVLLQQEYEIQQSINQLDQEMNSFKQQIEQQEKLQKQQQFEKSKNNSKVRVEKFLEEYDGDNDLQLTKKDIEIIKQKQKLNTSKLSSSKLVKQSNQPIINILFNNVNEQEDEFNTQLNKKSQERLKICRQLSEHLKQLMNSGFMRLQDANNERDSKLGVIQSQIFQFNQVVTLLKTQRLKKLTKLHKVLVINQQLCACAQIQVDQIKQRYQIRQQKCVKELKISIGNKLNNVYGRLENFRLNKMLDLHYYNLYQMKENMFVVANKNKLIYILKSKIHKHQRIQQLKYHVQLLQYTKRQVNERAEGQLRLVVTVIQSYSAQRTQLLQFKDIQIISLKKRIFNIKTTRKAVERINFILQVLFLKYRSLLQMQKIKYQNQLQYQQQIQQSKYFNQQNDIKIQQLAKQQNNSQRQNIYNSILELNELYYDKYQKPSFNTDNKVK